MREVMGFALQILRINLAIRAFRWETSEREKNCSFRVYEGYGYSSNSCQ